MSTVLLIRHGRTSANTAGVLVGRTSGIELDEAGLQQVAELAGRLSAVPLRAIVTSPLRRCRQTAQAVLSAQSDGCVMAVEQGLVECAYGEWTGRPLRELSKDKLWSAGPASTLGRPLFQAENQCRRCRPERLALYAAGTPV
jgi:2,3-bisphosphoglycerate-dependent phosphoglycerate mutase